MIHPKGDGMEPLEDNTLHCRHTHGRVGSLVGQKPYDRLRSYRAEGADHDAYYVDAGNPSQ